MASQILRCFSLRDAARTPCAGQPQVRASLVANPNPNLPGQPQARVRLAANPNPNLTLTLTCQGSRPQCKKMSKYPMLSRSSRRDCVRLG